MYVAMYLFIRKEIAIKFNILDRSIDDTKVLRSLNTAPKSDIVVTEKPKATDRTVTGTFPAGFFPAVFSRGFFPSRSFPRRFFPRRYFPRQKNTMWQAILECR